VVLVLVLQEALVLWPEVPLPARAAWPLLARVRPDSLQLVAARVQRRSQAAMMMLAVRMRWK
jgi:hypothetical protein